MDKEGVFTVTIDETVTVCCRESNTCYKDGLVRILTVFPDSVDVDVFRWFNNSSEWEHYEGEDRLFWKKVLFEEYGIDIDSIRENIKIDRSRWIEE